MGRKNKEGGGGGEKLTPLGDPRQYNIKKGWVDKGGGLLFVSVFLYEEEATLK